MTKLSDYSNAVQRTWARLVAGESVNSVLLQNSGLVEVGVEIRLSGETLTRVEVVRLTPEGLDLLDKTR